MFIIDKNHKIKLTKGDTATMFVEVFDLDKEPYEIQPTDVITLTIRKGATKPVALSKVADSDHYITINSDDTANMDAGLYVYQVELRSEGDYVYTIIPTSFFELTEDLIF